MFTSPVTLSAIRCRFRGLPCYLPVEGLQDVQSLEELRSREPGLPVAGLEWLAGEPAETQVAVFAADSHRWGLAVEETGDVDVFAEENLFALPLAATLNRDSSFAGVLLNPNEDGGEPFVLPLLDPVRISPLGLPTGFLEWPLRCATGPVRAVDLRQQRLLTFSLLPGDDLILSLGLSISQVLDIALLPDVSPLPGSHPALKGLIRWHDWPVPVVDPLELFGLGRQEDPTRVVIAQAAGGLGLVGLLTARAARSWKFPLSSTPCPAPLECETEFLRGCFELETGVMLLPDLEHLLGG